MAKSQQEPAAPPRLDENELNAAAADRSPQKDGLAHLNAELDPVAHVRALEREVDAVRERLRVLLAAAGDQEALPR